MFFSVCNAIRFRISPVRLVMHPDGFLQLLISASEVKISKNLLVNSLIAASCLEAYFRPSKRAEWHFCFFTATAECFLSTNLHRNTSLDGFVIVEIFCLDLLMWESDMRKFHY